jgi:hypothetical protein
MKDIDSGLNRLLKIGFVKHKDDDYYLRGNYVSPFVEIHWWQNRNISTIKQILNLMLCKILQMFSTVK